MVAIQWFLQKPILKLITCEKLGIIIKELKVLKILKIFQNISLSLHSVPSVTQKHVISKLSGLSSVKFQSVQMDFAIYIRADRLISKFFLKILLLYFKQFNNLMLL